MKGRLQNNKAGGRLAGDSGFKGFAAHDSGGSLSYFVEPPSLDVLSDPNVVVAFRSALKKDGTTKARGLEDLIQYTQAHPFDKDGGVEEALLQIWTAIYPRISIDSSRRVRELSHTLQYELLRSTRKRAEKYIPRIVGAWLAGLYDRDRAVSRAAADGLHSFLNTPEKMTAFWRKCHAQILDFAIECIRESPETLSDERFSKEEDVQAKYHRVISASLSLVLGLLERLDGADLLKLRDQYDDFFSHAVVWHSIAFSEPAVRKAVCRLMMVCLDRKLPYAEAPVARKSILLGGLKTAQSGSAEDFAKALIRMSKADPETWSPALNKGKSLLPKLQQFLTKGSQGGSASFWASAEQLIDLLPRDQLRDLSVASGFMSALKLGISSREEPRTHLPVAWKCFTETGRLFLDVLCEDDKLHFVQQQIFPLFDQSLFPAPDKTISVFSGPKFVPSLVDLHLMTIRSSPAIVSASKDEWHRLADLLCAEISNSLPEVSREYTSSQERLGDKGRRWFGLVGEMHQRLSDVGEVLPDQTTEPSRKVVLHGLSCLKNRDMKPFGAAQMLETAMTACRHLFVGETMRETLAFLSMTAEGSMAKALQSASSRPLISCLQVLGGIPSQETDYARLWNSWVEAALNVAEAPTRLIAVSSLISQEKGASLARSNNRLQESIIREFDETVKGQASSWELLKTVASSQGLTEESCKTLARGLIQTLESDAELTGKCLQALQMIVKGQQRLFSEDQDLQTTLVAQLLGLSEISDGAYSSKALAIRALLEGGGSGPLPVINIIHANLERAGPQSLKISTLLAQAQQAFDDDAPVEEIFPSTNVWMQKLAPFLDQPLNPSLSITNALGGAIALSNKNARLSDLRTISRDRQGRSIPLRMALYAAELLEGKKADKSKLPVPFQIELLFIQCLNLQLATDQLTSREYNGLWLHLDEAESIAEAESFVAGLRHIIKQSSLGAQWWDESAEDEESQVLRGLVKLLKQESSKLTPRGVYSARALSEIVCSLVESQGLPPALEESLLKPALAKAAAPETALLSAALLSGLRETLQSSKLASNFCNRLISDVAAAKPEDDKTLMTLSLLTLSARSFEVGELPVASNRIVFAVKQIVSWLEYDQEILSAPLYAELCRALALLLPCMSSIFGSYWEKAIEFCTDLWEMAPRYPLPDALPFIHASLKLIKTLETLPDPNDDLSDALKESAGKISKSLLELLRLPRGGTSQPLDIVDAMLSREVEKIDIKRIPELSDMYELVASESRDIQSAAFSLLYRAIPAEAEKRAVETLLDKTDARLPDELLSLLLDAPTLDKFSDEMLAQFPSAVRSYLLSWKLVFSALSASPFKMRGDLVEHLKTECYVSQLLDFTFDVLGHSAAKPLNLEKEHISGSQMRDYDIKVAEGETEEKSMHWLLVHLFFQTLKYAPVLFKQWFLECRSKQTRIAVEAWTARYVSPLIISDVLDDVQAWGDDQETTSSSEDRALTIRVLKSAREVTASFEVDDAQASIAIRIPPAYPLDAVTVSSVNRVAVTERRWQGWIAVTQGAIAFSGGSVIDGLQVFRRNMAGALRGQTECAICYSVISTDKRVPDKRCGTCRNLFHRSCLYKWFQTSNQNTCPLCRNPIDYLGSDTMKRRQG